MQLKTIIALGGCAFAFGDVLCALAPSLALLLTGRVIQAVGTGLTMPLVFTLIMQQVPLAQQGSFNGTAGMLIALAPSLGPTYGGLVTQLLIWRLIFWFVLPVGIISGLVAILNVEQVQKTVKQTFPFWQFLLVVAALVLIALGFNSAGSAGFLAPQFYLPILIAVVFLILFTRLALNAQVSLINVRIFRNGAFLKALCVYFVIQFVQIGINFLLPNFAQLALGTDAMTAGLMLLAGSLISAVLSPLAGRWMDNVGVKKPLRLGSCLLIFALVLFAFSVQHLTVAKIVVFYILYMAGFSLMFNNALTYGLQRLPERQMGDGNGTFNTLQQYAGSLGTAVMAAMLAFGAQLNPQAKAGIQTIAGSQLAFWVALGLIILVTIVVFSITDQTD